MSTKTTFKRIALVAVAALGLGVLSVAPSQATVSSLTVTGVDGTSTLSASAYVSDSSTAATLSVSALHDSLGDTTTVTFIEKSKPAGGTATPYAYFMDTTTPTGATVVDTATLVTTPVASMPKVILAGTGTAGAAQAIGSAVFRIDAVSTTGYVGAKFAVQLDSASARVAGTYTYTAVVKGYHADGTAPTTTTKDISIVIAAAASASETPSSAYSAVYLAGANTTAPVADSATVSGVATAGTTAGNLNVLVRNALNGTAAVDTVTITVSGPGLIDTTSDTKYLQLKSTGDVAYPIIGDGTAGVTTITVTYELTKQTFTKSLTFYAANAKTLTPSVRTPILKVGTNTGAASVSAVDANGSAWLGTAYIAAKTAADALVAGSTTPAACSAWTATNGIRCDITGVSAGTATLVVMDASTLAASKATA